MNIELKILEEQLEEDYNGLLETCESSMFNHSLKYRRFLSAVLENASSKYFCLYLDGRLEASLPLFIKECKFGKVVNSLPYYGSHGGLLKRADSVDELNLELFRATDDLCREIDARTCTLIESPTDVAKECYNSFGADLCDYRIGQISKLPIIKDEQTYDDVLLQSYHQKTRNLVRKGMKGEFYVDHDGNWATFEALHEIHVENMLKVNGRAKSLSIYKAIREIFQYDEDYRIYTASKNGEIAAGLLVFYYKDMVEYFTPVVRHQYRNQQPLSLLIFRAMKDAALQKSLSRWNWGGTWLSQDGVYHFKARWGSKDHPYKYHVKTFSNIDDLRKVDQRDLLREFQDFFVFPINR